MSAFTNLLALGILLFLINSSVDSHPACVFQSREKEILDIPIEFFQFRELRDSPAVFNVIFDSDVPVEVEQGIDSALNVLAQILETNVTLTFFVNMTSGGSQWGYSNSSFWTVGYPQFISNLSLSNTSQIFPKLNPLVKEIHWPSGWGWTSGRILLTNWQAYSRGFISQNSSEFTMSINKDWLSRFDFNASDGTDPGKYDFETIILHQLMHELGFESVVDLINANWTNPDSDFVLYPLDVFRFSYQQPSDAQNVLTDLRQFDPTVSPHTFWDGSLQIPVPMERGVNFTGFSADHWLHQNGTNLFGIMDGNISTGIAVGFSPNDIASFKTMGWQTKANIIPILSDAFINGSFVIAEGNLLIGPVFKCRFNGTYVVDPSDLPSDNYYKNLTCPIPVQLQNWTFWENSTPFNNEIWLELSNDGGNTWSPQVRATNTSSSGGGGGGGSSSPASTISGKNTWLTLIFAVLVIFLSGSGQVVF